MQCCQLLLILDIDGDALLDDHLDELWLVVPRCVVKSRQSLEVLGCQLGSFLQQDLG